MVRARAVTDLDIVRIARRAVELRRAAVERYCAELGEWSRKRFDYCREPERVRYFSKREFARAAREYMRETGLRAKWETLFRKLRRLAELGDTIAYVNKRKGIYKLVEGYEAEVNYP